MTETAAEAPRAASPARAYRSRAVSLPHALVEAAGHAPGLGLLLLLALWLTRRWLLTPALPAGTDMLGFVSRAAQNDGLSHAVSLWSPGGWGARRALTLESLLGLGASITGDPVLTIKLFSLALLAASGGFTYALAWRFGRSRLAAAAAGVLYMSSQGSLSHWASGHVNVEVAIALMPLLLLLWCESVDRFSLAHSCWLAVAAAATVLARPDLLLYPMPFMALYVALRLVVGKNVGRTLRDAALTTLVAAPAIVALSLYLVVPSAAGIRARWLTAGSLFDMQQLVDRSVGAYSSLLGFAREIGYLAFTGQQTWTSHPWLPFPAYAASASVVVLLAYAGPVARRCERTLFLGCTAVLATFMAKGLRAPGGGLYLWGVRHVPVFGNLRDPNRWLLVQGLAYAVLAGVTLAWIVRRIAGNRRRRSRVAGAAAAFGALSCAALLPVAPTLVSGFRTLTIASSQQALLRRVAADSQPALVVSLPYDQTYRFVAQSGYRGWEHDLGAESAAFTGDPAIGDGGWDQQAADTVAYTSSLLKRRDPAFVRILGSLGVKYLLGFGYPATDPHVLDASAGPLYQQRAAASMPGLKTAATTQGGRLYRLTSFAPLVSFRPNIALVLGGRQGIGALADLPGIDLRSWAAFTADDVLARGGIAQLLALVRRANLIVVANTTPNDLAVLASAPVASLAGITSDPGLDRKSQIVPSDGSIRLGSLADQSAPAVQIGRSSSLTKFRLRHERDLELWARLRSSPGAARLEFRLDSRPAGTITPLTPSLGGFRWYLVGRRRLGPGLHSIDVRATTSPFGRGYELDEAKLVDPAERASLATRIQGVLAQRAARTLYAFDPGEIQPPVSIREVASTSLPVSGAPRTFWRVLEPAHVTKQPGMTGLSVRLAPGRRFHTLLEHSYGRGLDWSGIDHLLLRFRGTASGTRYRLLVDFDAAHRRSRSFAFTDGIPGWQLVAFSTLPARPQRVSRWSHVVSVRIASDDRDAAGTLTLGTLGASRAAARSIAVSVLPAGSARVVTGGGSLVVRARDDSLRVRLTPSLLGSVARVLVYPTAPIRSLPAVPVRFQRTGPTSYRFDLATAHSGVLLLAQSFDPRWRARIDGTTRGPVSAFALDNGYVLRAGRHSGSIGFSGQNYGALGAGLSGAGLIVVVAVALCSRRRNRDWDA